MTNKAALVLVSASVVTGALVGFALAWVWESVDRAVERLRA